MLEYRCTRNQPYQHDCDDKDSLTARQGHYVQAKSEDEALAKMRDRFPGDTAGFTVKFWKKLAYT